MGYSVENQCLFCPQGCVHCGRDIPRKMYYCDKCMEYTEELYEGIHGDEICSDCYLKQFPQKEFAYCDKCNEMSDFVFRVDGEWLCLDCTMEKAERINTEGD